MIAKTALVVVVLAMYGVCLPAMNVAVLVGYLAALLIEPKL